MQTRSQITRRAVSRSLAVILFAALAVSMVSCGKLASPTGVDQAVIHSEIAGKIKPDAQPATIPYRAPLDSLTAPDNLQIVASSWAWQVSWDAAPTAVRYQLFEHVAAANSWQLLAETRATRFNVPLAHAPHSIELEVRALAADGELSDFSQPISVGAPAIVSIPNHVQITHNAWAWHVTWFASSGSLAAYQVFQYHADTQSLELLVTTRATQFDVPLTHSPGSISIQVRALDTAGNASPYSVPVDDQIGPQTVNSGPGAGGTGIGSGSNGGGGVVGRATAG